MIRAMITIKASPNHINHGFRVFPRAIKDLVTALAISLVNNDGILDRLGNCGYVYAHGIPLT